MSGSEQNQVIGDVEAFDEGLTQSVKRLGLESAAIILACSGGADSTAMLIAAARVGPRLRLKLTVATLDHGLRPEAQREVLAVKGLAAANGLPVVTRALGLLPGPALEERARTARYAALEDLRREASADFVATAHTATDQAETLLMRLGRGASLKGAAAILERRGALVRPLLFATRAQVRAYLAARAAVWAEDPMNTDLAYLRVRVREQVLPALEQAFDRGVTSRLAQFARLAGEDEALIAALADDGWKQVCLADGNLSAAALAAAPRPVARRWLSRYLSERGVPLDFDLVLDALVAIASGRNQTLPGDQVLATRAGVVRIEPSAPRSKK